MVTVASSPSLSEIARHLSPLSSDCFAARIKPFIEWAEDRPVAEVTPLDLIAYRQYLLANYAPRTARHRLTTAKRLIRWAASIGMRSPIDMAAIPPIELDYNPKDVWTPSEINSLLDKARRFDPRVEAWARFQYLTATRPSEVVRLVNDEGIIVSENLLSLTEHKTATRSKMPRYIAVSPKAIEALKEARGAKPQRRAKGKTTWSRLDSYSNALYRATGFRPHLLRHSAATHLLEAGVPRADVDLILGHSVGNRVSLTYMKVLAREYESLVPQVAQLADNL